MKKENRHIVCRYNPAQVDLFMRMTLLRELVRQGDKIESLAVVITKNAKSINEYETSFRLYDKGNIKEFDNNDFSAPFASGSCGYDTMIICPLQWA